MMLLRKGRWRWCFCMKRVTRIRTALEIGSLWNALLILSTYCQIQFTQLQQLLISFGILSLGWAPKVGLLWPFWGFYWRGLWAKFVYFRDFCNISNSSLTPADILSGNLVSLYCLPVFTVHYTFSSIPSFCHPKKYLPRVRWYNGIELTNWSVSLSLPNIEAGNCASKCSALNWQIDLCANRLNLLSYLLHLIFIRFRFGRIAMVVSHKTGW